MEHRDVLSLIDTGSPDTSVGRILRGLRRIGREPEDVRQIVLSHCHGDHSGQAGALVEATGATVVAGADDVPVIEGRAPYPGPTGPLGNAIYGRRFGRFARLPVDRAIRQREELEGGLVAVPAPGHTAGHIAVVAPDHGALFIGDAVWHLGPILPSWKALTQDPEANAETIRELAGLGLGRILPGHGPDFAGERLARLSVR